MRHDDAGSQLGPDVRRADQRLGDERRSGNPRERQQQLPPPLLIAEIDQRQQQQAQQPGEQPVQEMQANC